MFLWSVIILGYNIQEDVLTVIKVLHEILLKHNKLEKQIHSTLAIIDLISS